MCKPTHFQIKYKINPWMKLETVNKSLAMYQWKSLVNIYKKLGIKVSIINQDKNFPDMVFAADQGIVLKDKILISNFKYKERQGESILYRKWFIKNNIKVETIPNDIIFEGGGESVDFKNNLLVGVGFRTNLSAINYLSKKVDKKIITLKLINDSFYHLDTCLFVLDDKYIFYYPQAFSKSSITTIKTLSENIFEISEKEASNFAANSVFINGTVIIQANNPAFKNKIESLGYKVVKVDVGEFAKAGGGIHCLTGIID